MAAYQFTITESFVQGEIESRFGVASQDTTNILEAVFPGAATSVDIRFDRGYSREISHKMLTAQFGDGYSQRIRDGINSQQETYSVTFNNRTAEEAEVISAFFDLSAVTGFSIISGSNEAIKVKCESYTINYLYDAVYSIQTTFTRIYEP